MNGGGARKVRAQTVKDSPKRFRDSPKRKDSPKRSKIPQLNWGVNQEFGSFKQPLSYRNQYIVEKEPKTSSKLNGKLNRRTKQERSEK